MRSIFDACKSFVWINKETALEISRNDYRQALEVITGEKYIPEARCPKCQKNMSENEILNGFLPDPYDLTTKCVSCGCRFEADLKIESGKEVKKYRYYCPAQTLQVLKDMCRMSPKKIKEKFPGVYHSAIVHFQSLRNAFKKIGKKYRFNEIVKNWQKKVYGFLGKVPDAQLARLVGVSGSTVTRYRNKQDIKPYTKPKDGYYA